MKRVWIVNPDAEVELAWAAKSPGRAYQPPAPLLAQQERNRNDFQRLTLSDELLFLSDLAQSPQQVLTSLHTSQLLLWCPTLQMRTQLARLGLSSPHLPSWRAVQVCNDKRFLDVLPGCHLPRRAAISSRVELDSWLANENAIRSVDVTSLVPVGKGGQPIARVKKPFGCAGRGQRRLAAVLSPDDERFIDNACKDASLRVEPECHQARLAALHGLLRSDAQVIWGTPRALQVDRYFQPQLVEHTEKLAPAETQRIHSLGEQVAHALHREGYHGPFGLDFVEYRGPAAASGFYVIDINARFSLGWSLGMGNQREQALLAYQQG